MINRLIVSRHAATVEWLRSVAGEDVPVLASATADDVRGKVVYGNLPLHLAAEAYLVFAVTFEQPLPRGEDVLDIEAYGPRVEPFVVRRSRGEAHLWEELTATAPIVGATAPIRPVVPDARDDGDEGELVGAIGTDGVYRSADQWREMGREALFAQRAAERGEEAGK